MVVFVEPHYDDFLLSAGMYCKSRPIDAVVTVFYSDYNSGGTRALCEDLGKKYVELKLPDMDWKQPSILFDPTYLHNALVPLLSEAETILTVLGVGHHAHRFLREFILEKFKTKDLRFFRDFPHAYDSTKLKNLPFETYIKDFELIEQVGSIEGFNDKVDMFKKYYPSQKGIMWFEKEQFSNPVFEEIYRFKEMDRLW